MERVDVEKHVPGYPPLYGYIVFKNALAMTAALNGQRSGKFIISERVVWTRVCKPRPRRPLGDVGEITADELAAAIADIKMENR